MKSIAQYIAVVPFVMLCNVVLTFEYVNAIIKCDYSDERYRAVLSVGGVYYSARGGSHISVGGCSEMPEMPDHSMKL